MRKLPKYIAMVAVSAAATAALPAASYAQDRDRDEDRRRDEPREKIIRAEDLPDAVRRTIEREAIGKNHYIDYRDRDDKVRYVVHFTAPDGQRMRIRVDERGELIEAPSAAREQYAPGLEEEHARDDSDRSVRYTAIRQDEVPDRVMRTFDKFREGMHDLFFRRQIRDGETFYSMHYTTPPGERKWVRVAANGEVAEGPHINIREDIGLRIARDERRSRVEPGEMRRAEIGVNELPVNIRRSIEEETAGGTEHRFFRETQGNRRTYFVEYTAKDGQRVHVRMNEDGEVIREETLEEARGEAPEAQPAAEMSREELTADQLPAEVRRTIEEQTPGAIQHRFIREVKGDQVSYFVEYTKDGQRGNLRVDERGKVLGETEVAEAPRPRPDPRPQPAPASDEDAQLTAEAQGNAHVMVPVGDLPAEVRQAFEQQTPNGTNHIVQRHTRDGQTYYTAHYRTAEEEHNLVVVDDRGRVVVEPRKSRWLEGDKDVRFEPLSADQLPPEVREGIEKQAPRATQHLFIRRDRPQGEPTYLVQFTNPRGERMQMEVNSKGRLRGDVSAAQEDPFRLVGRRDRDRN